MESNTEKINFYSYNIRISIGSFQNETNRIIMKIVVYGVGMFASMAVSIGLTFKLLHWPGADELITYGFIAFTLLFIPLIAIISSVVTGFDKTKKFLGLAASVVTGLSVVFKLLHLQGADMLLLAGTFLFSVGYLPFLFYGMYKKSVT